MIKPNLRGVNQPKRGIRVPGSRRDLASRRPKFMSLGHREKLAAAKRGQTGEKSNRWKGGHLIGGYTQIGGGKQKRYAHREIAENLLKRKLLTGEHIHHIDRVRTHNEPPNMLVLMTSGHTRLHTAMRRNPELDQRQWLKDHQIAFEDLQNYV